MWNLLYKKIKKNYILAKNFNIFFSNKTSIIYVKGTYGVICLKLPSIYFFINDKNIKSLILLKKNWFNSFLTLFFLTYKRLFILYFIRLKIKGLGYRIRKLTKNFYYFFFNYTNMYYINIPKNIIVKWYKKRIILVSFDFHMLKLLMSTIIILKKLGPYRLRGLKYPRQIILIKKRKKSF